VEAVIDDATLWLRASAGDAVAFGDLYERHRNRVYTYCLQRTLSRPDSEDLVAEVFTETWRRRRDVVLTETGGLRPWLLSTANNMMRRGWRKQKVERKTVSRLPLEEVPDIAEEVTDEAARDQQLSVVATVLASMSRSDRDVLQLCVLQGIPPSDVAKVTGEPAVTVRSRLSRALSRARTRFAELQQTDQRSARKED
jgi:RNA polymerase sigma factor (sigma-70 family)